MAVARELQVLLTMHVLAFVVKFSDLYMNCWKSKFNNWEKFYFNRHPKSTPTDSTWWKLLALLLSRLADFPFLLARASHRPIHPSLHINVQFAALCQNRVRNGRLDDDDFTEITTMTTGNTNGLLINALTAVFVAVVSNWATLKYYHELGMGMLLCWKEVMILSLSHCVIRFSYSCLFISLFVTFIVLPSEF